MAQTWSTDPINGSSSSAPATLPRWRDAAGECIERGLTLDDLTRETFRIPAVEAKLHDAIRTVSTGTGFHVFRGLPVGRWGEEFTSLVYWGMAQHLGLPGVQNPQGEKLGHVRDYGEGPRHAAPLSHEEEHRLPL